MKDLNKINPLRLANITGHQHGYLWPVSWSFVNQEDYQEGTIRPFNKVWYARFKLQTVGVHWARQHFITPIREYSKP